ncbi:hypothetical protein E4T44_00003 [Aureobasidium sp. EXF-8845]|nr:hypothetical protein E4T44_00003 [Aureobasidium sp. EXF-8845]KAI4858450.1 hypothetical protein E4T45_00020 [Aureobasidium sp. EXF-8846]
MQKEPWISSLRKELLHASTVRPESVHTERRLSIPTVAPANYAVSLPTSTSLSIPETSMANLSALTDSAADALPIDAGDHEGDVTDLNDNDNDNDGDKDDDNDDAAPASYKVICEAAPPERRFPSFEAAIEFGNQWSRDSGFDLVRINKGKQGRNPQGVTYKFLWECKRHGKPANTRKLTPDRRQRAARGSVRIGCRMRIVLVAVEPQVPQGEWQIRHCGRNGHNHGPDNAESFPAVRRRTRTHEMDVFMATQLRQGLSRSETLQLVRQHWPDALVTRQDIGNFAKTFASKIGASRLTPEATPDNSPMPPVPSASTNVVSNAPLHVHHPQMQHPQAQQSLAHASHTHQQHPMQPLGLPMQQPNPDATRAAYQAGYQAAVEQHRINSDLNHRVEALESSVQVQDRIASLEQTVNNLTQLIMSAYMPHIQHPQS